MGVHLYGYVETFFDGKWQGVDDFWSGYSGSDICFDGINKSYTTTGFLCDVRTPREIEPHENASAGWPNDVSAKPAKWEKESAIEGEPFGLACYTLADLHDADWSQVSTSDSVDSVLECIFGDVNFHRLNDMILDQNLEDHEVRILFYCR